MNLNDRIDNYIKQKHYQQIHSILVVQNSEICAERYYYGFQKEDKSVIKSIAKSIMSICTGICLDQGLLTSLEEPVGKYLPQFREGRDPLHPAIKIRHLLTMTSGIYWNGGVHYHCPMLQQMRNSGDWISHIADCAVAEIPGTKYNYKEWDVILLAQVLNCICGDMYEFLEYNLYQPLEIQSERWYQSPCGVFYSIGNGKEEEEAYSNLTARDLLKLGELFLNDGIYHDKRVISSKYIQQATTPIACNSGYGFLWWLGENWYGCRGYGGQNITVMPEKKAVFVMQATPTLRGMGYDDVAWFCMDLLEPVN